ncbi:unnamed protein product [Penicillium camemberti]|uniref:Str. FM013 n=1 Tax=Penicillium camemberti (strain FM 013) TaxID=1429867 RepID=A0A0G4PUL1_PENC3|nr:unnamed protein product [Penicillium camemberti]
MSDKPSKGDNQGNAAANLGSAHNESKDDTNKLDPKGNPDPNTHDPEHLAASTRFMPQAGKAAGITKQQEQSEDSNQDDHRHENIAGSRHFIPQAGKPAGNSSL